MKRLEVWLADLNPTVGSEMKKTRPAIIVSPDELNLQVNTVLVVPLTTGRALPFRVPTRVQGKLGHAALDQMRTLDKRRLLKRIGTLDAPTGNKLLAKLAEFFAP